MVLHDTQLALPYLFSANVRFEASAPCRINCGGTWDLPAFALPYEWLAPTTVNIALELRTRVSLTGYKEGMMRVSSTSFPSEEMYLLDASFDSRFGLIAAIVSHFGIHGVNIDIESESPPRSGLGGSGSLAVALIAALDGFRTTMGFPGMSLMEIVMRAHAIENGLGISMSGLQDQAAAAYGGVNQWIWSYSTSGAPFRQHSLISQEQYRELEDHFLVAYIGITHSSSALNKQWLTSFLSGKDRAIWFKIHALTKEFAAAIQGMEWGRTAELLRMENSLRNQISSEMVPAIASGLIKSAEDLSCGSRFAGAGGGGCVWAIGRQPDIHDLKVQWQQKLGEMGGRLLPSKIAEEGVIVSMT